MNNHTNNKLIHNKIIHKPQVFIDKTIDLLAATLLSEHCDVKIIDTTRISKEEIINADILCIRTNTIINEEYLQDAKNLKIIATATTGINHINTDIKDITLIDAKGANADSVADYVFRMLFQITDDAHYTNKLLKDNPEMFLKLKKENKRKELASLSLGIIGLGNIGKRVAKRAIAFGMNVLAYDPYVDDAKNTLEEVLKCDIVTIHAELTNETYGMITTDKLKLLKENAILINAARAEIINEEALIQVLKENTNMHFIVDVFTNEPKPSIFYNMPNCTITPHIAGNAKEAKIRAAKMIAQKIISIIEQERVVIEPKLLTRQILIH
jgi:D-3-phosphoglycerate dehydrogenase